MAVAAPRIMLLMEIQNDCSCVSLSTIRVLANIVQYMPDLQYSSNTMIYDQVTKIHTTLGSQSTQLNEPGLKYSLRVSIVTGAGICLFLPLDWNSSATLRFTSVRMSRKCSFLPSSCIVSTKALINHEPYSEFLHET